jgi:hypothetical protein
MTQSLIHLLNQLQRPDPSLLLCGCLTDARKSKKNSLTKKLLVANLPVLGQLAATAIRSNMFTSALRIRAKAWMMSFQGD